MIKLELPKAIISRNDLRCHLLQFLYSYNNDDDSNTTLLIYLIPCRKTNIFFKLTLKLALTSQ